MARYLLASVSLPAANAFVGKLHRHSLPVQGHKFSLGAFAAGQLVGVAIVGRPVARGRDTGAMLEITRLCTDGSEHACSFLYGAAARAAFALGFAGIGTYTLPEESGSSLRAVGWQRTDGRGGSSWAHRKRYRKPAPVRVRVLWEKMHDDAEAVAAAIDEQKDAPPDTSQLRWDDIIW